MCAGRARWAGKGGRAGPPFRGFVGGACGGTRAGKWGRRDFRKGRESDTAAAEKLSEPTRGAQPKDVFFLPLRLSLQSSTAHTQHRPAPPRLTLVVTREPSHFFVCVLDRPRFTPPPHPPHKVCRRFVMIAAAPPPPPASLSLSPPLSHRPPPTMGASPVAGAPILARLPTGDSAPSQDGWKRAPVYGSSTYGLPLRKRREARGRGQGGVSDRKKRGTTLPPPPPSLSFSRTGRSAST